MSERAQHVVLFRFHRELNGEEERWMRERVREWPETIGGFTGLRLGKDVGGRSNGYDYLLLTEFESEEAHQSYYAQPAHVAFSEWAAAVGCDLIRVDYPLTEESFFL